MNIEQYGMYFLYTLIYVAFAVILKQVLNQKAAGVYSADEEMVNGNLAVGIRRSGAQLGLAIAMMGVLGGSSAPSIVDDLLLTALYGFIGTIFIISSLLVTDKCVIPGVNNLECLKDNNIAVGIVEFGMLVSTGIIAFASLSGESGGPISSVVYFIAGQITLVALILVYEKVILRHFNLVASLKDGHLSTGIYLAGKLIAYALILKSAISGNSVHTAFEDLALEFILISLSGMVLLYVFEYIIDLVIVTSSTIKDILERDQVAPVVQLSVAKIGVALILSHAIL